MFLRWTAGVIPHAGEVRVTGPQANDHVYQMVFKNIYSSIL